MKLNEYPIFTIILRNYTIEQANAVYSAIDGFEKYFCVEVTLNTDQAIQIIKMGNERYGNKIFIGAGTVLNLDKLKGAVDVGAKFVLGPNMFTKEMINYCKKHSVISIPAGMTPTEIHNLFNLGADIVKVFPAHAVGPEYFSSVQAPFGRMNLMAVGGVSLQNIGEYKKNGSKYFGIGSSMFEKKDIESLNVENMRRTLQNYINLI